MSADLPSDLADSAGTTVFSPFVALTPELTAQPDKSKTIAVTTADIIKICIFFFVSSPYIRNNYIVIIYLFIIIVNHFIDVY